MRHKKKTKSKTKLVNKQKQKARRQELMYHLKPLLLTFVVWFAAKLLINIPAIGNEVASFFVHFTVQATYIFGKLFFIPIELNNSPFITVNNFTMRVVWECTAYNFYLLVIILTIFSRWTLKQKFISLGYFLLFVFVMNKLRFISMGYVGSYAPQHFDAIHDFFWNIIFGFLVFGLWVWREMRFQQKKIKTT